MSAADTLMAEFHAKADAALPAMLREAAAAALDRALSGAGPLLRIDDAGRLFFGESCDWKQARREFVKLKVPFYRLSSRDHRVNVAEVRKAIQARRVDVVRGGRGNAEVSEGGTRDSRIETAAQSRPSLH